MAERKIHRKQFLIAAGALVAGVAGLGKTVWSGKRLASTPDQASLDGVRLRGDPRAVSRVERI
jgi:hypothetical protein